MARGPFSTSNYFRSASSPIGSTPLTISAWVWTAVTGANQTVFVAGSSAAALGATEFWMGIGANDKPACNTSGVTATGSSNVPTSQWVHLLGVIAAANSRAIYMNGVLQATNTTNVAAPSPVDAYAIGVNGKNAASRTAPFGGRIAQLGVWDQALDADEIVSLSKGFAPASVRPARLVLDAPLVRELIDVRGSPLGMTGTVSVADHCRVYLPR